MKHKYINTLLASMALIIILFADGLASDHVMYIYDDLNRLVGETYVGAKTSPYQYDPMGNRLGKRTGNGVILEQSVNLAAGLNWVSFQALPADVSFNAFFADILSAISSVTTQTQSKIYSNGVWTGDLPDMGGIASGMMYKIEVAQSCTLDVRGFRVAPSTPIPLTTGLNWVAYLPGAPLLYSDALVSILPNVTQVQSQTQSVTRVGDTFIGDLTYMQPGQGYIIQMQAPGNLVYPD